MVKYWDWLNQSDHVSFCCQFFFSVILSLYLVFVMYYALVKSRQMAMYEKAKINNKRLMEVSYQLDTSKLSTARLKDLYQSVTFEAAKYDEA